MPALSTLVRPLHCAHCRMAGWAAAIAICIVAAWSAAALNAQAPQVTPVGQGLQTDSITSAALGAERSAEPSTLTYFNRPIVVLRARVIGREPTERVLGARRILDDLVGAR